ncbi:MAG: HEAT repeat domain-containing protein [Clostridium sp.]|uniref:HEAT repeat domain-containing protein n=1 Tax=Clostridium sp. TaxID=1506 RepID=UPI003F3770BA
MSFVIYIYTALKFFIYMIFCATAYMIYRNKADSRFKEKNVKLEDDIRKEILECRRTQKIDKGLIRRYKKEFENELFFISFNDVIIEMKEEYKVDIREWIKYFLPEINKKMKKYKNPIKRNYLSFCLGEYGVYTKEIEKYLLEGIRKSKGELSYKAISATARIGEAGLFLKALEEVRRKNIYINKKIFVDILDSFTGDKKILNKEIYKIFNESDENFKVIIINYFENTRAEKYKETFFEMLKNEESLEIKLSIIRYFEKVRYDKVKDTLIELLKDEIWEIRALSATTLGTYFDEVVKGKLVYTLGDRNFNVRLNSATTLLKKCSVSEMECIANEHEDKYAKDIIYYELLSENKISYEKYNENKKEVI